MKKHLLTLLIAFLLCIGTTAQAQHRFTLGWVAGAGTTATKELNRYYNTAQYSMSAGVDMSFQVWRGLYLTGRAEYQKRYYLLNPTNIFITSDPLAIKDAIQYQAGLSLRDKHFYASIGPTFSDNLNGSEEQMLYFCGVGLTDEELNNHNRREYFSSWGWYANIGYQRPLTPRANIMVELGHMSECTDLNSYYIDPLSQFTIRVGSQFQLNR